MPEGVIFSMSICFTDQKMMQKGENLVRVDVCSKIYTFIIYVLQGTHILSPKIVQEIGRNWYQNMIDTKVNLL